MLNSIKEEDSSREIIDLASYRCFLCLNLVWFVLCGFYWREAVLVDMT